MQSAKLSEQLAVVATVDPATLANTEVFTDVVDMGAMHQAMAVLALGDLPSETVDFKAYSCDANGSNAAAITGLAATQLAASAAANDGKQIVINVRSEHLQASGKQHVKFGAVTGGATGGPACVLVLGQPRQGVGSTNDLSSVVEIVG